MAVGRWPTAAMVLTNDERQTTAMRLFIALDIDDAIRQRIQRFMEV